MVYDAGLILEGGGMRGVYTAGVLDFFIDKEIVLKNCIGVSAGAVHGCSYVSWQKRRAYHVVVDSIDDKRYASMENLIKTGFFFGEDYNLNIVPKKFPYDYEAYNKSETSFYAAVTNIETGKAEYLKINDMEKEVNYIWASGSLPLMAKPVKINGKLYMDGGIADSIPIKASMKMGFKKNIIVLTRDKDYRKEKTSTVQLVRMRYPKYPKLAETLKNRHIDYNKTIEYINEMEKKGEVFVIRPSIAPDIGRLEKNKEKLKKLYKLGYEDAKKSYDKMIDYLN